MAIVILCSNHWSTPRRIAARIAAAVEFVQPVHIATSDVATLRARPALRGLRPCTGRVGNVSLMWSAESRRAHSC
jgi:hypothetical protein